MKIGFDLDGVIISCDSYIWGLARDNEPVLRLALEESKPLLNPRMFTSETDEIYFITARTFRFWDLTKRWCNHFFPGIKLVLVKVESWKDQSKWNDWYKTVATEKAKAINKLKLDVYFEDMPITVKHLRELCPNTKIIQYGGRIGRSEDYINGGKK